MKTKKVKQEEEMQKLKKDYMNIIRFANTKEMIGGTKLNRLTDKIF